MSKFTFTRQFKGFGDTKTTVEFDAELLDDLLEQFTQFLRGCGYTIEGRLDVVNDDEWSAHDPSAKPWFTHEKDDLDLYTENLFAKK